MKDVIIIGGGPAAYTAALYASRAELETVVLEGMLPGGRISLTDIVENYPGIAEPISGMDLAQIMREQAQKAGAEVIMDIAENIEHDEKTRIFTVTTPYDQKFQAKAVILATGTTDKKLDVPGEKEFTGKGVSYCATCDGPFYRDKLVAVVGGGDSAVKEALFLTNLAKQVTIIHRRDKLRAEKVIQTKAFNKPNLNIMWDTVVVEINGEKSVQSLKLKNVKTGKTSDFEVDGVFILIGSVPNSNLVEKFNLTDKQGFVPTEPDMSTSIPGLFIAGDIRPKTLHQVTTAVGDGSIAAYSVQEYLENFD